MKTRRTSSMVVPATPKVVGYVRVSTAGQVEDGVSINAQTERIRMWHAGNAPAAELQIFTDEGLSGGRMDNRPGLEQALAAVGRGDVLAVYSLSRLSRSTCDLLSVAEDLRDRGADLASITEKIDTTGAAGRMIFRVLSVLCEFERDLVSERTIAALSYKRNRGEKTGGSRPFGFQVTDEGHLVRDEQEQKTIAAMRRMRSRGASYRTIGAKFGGRHPQVVRQILDRVERSEQAAA